MLQASRQLEGYLTHERNNLNRMNLNENVSSGFLDVKVESYNGLVDTLNNLFTVLTGVGSPLFERYSLGDDEEPVIVQLPSYVSDILAIQDATEVPVLRPPHTPAEGIAEAMTELGVTERTDDPPTSEEIELEIAQREANESEQEATPVWMLDGYPTHEAWVEDKESESEESRDDSAIVMDVGLSQHRAGQILTEYSESAEQDIDTYTPEDDVPVSVISDGQEDDGEPDRATRDLRYLSHTVDDTRIDTDPAQITRVETAVEREGENGSRGPTIDVASYSYQSSDDYRVEDLISDDINKLRKPSSDD